MRSLVYYLADVGAANRLLQLAQDHQARAIIRHPRQLNVRDFEENGGFVLPGGALANPWYALFESRLNFTFEIDANTGKALIRNKAPQPGEQITWSANDGHVSVDFAVADLLPNLKGSWQRTAARGHGYASHGSRWRHGRA